MSTTGAKTPLRNAYLQTNLDARGFEINNLGGTGITPNFGPQLAHYVYAGPTVGGPDFPTFRPLFPPDYPLAMLGTNNLSDVSDALTARTSLGLTVVATAASSSIGRAILNINSGALEGTEVLQKVDGVPQWSLLADTGMFIPLSYLSISPNLKPDNNVLVPTNLAVKSYVDARTARRLPSIANDTVVSNLITDLTTKGYQVDVTTSSLSILKIVIPDGEERIVRFTGAPITLVDSNSFLLPAGLDILTAAGAYGIFRGLSSVRTEVVYYQDASGHEIADFKGGRIASLDSLSLRSPTSNSPYSLEILPLTTLTADRQLLLSTHDRDVIVDLAGDIMLGAQLSTDGAVQFSGAFPSNFNITANTNVTFPIAGTLLSTVFPASLSLTYGNFTLAGASLNLHGQAVSIGDADVLNIATVPVSNVYFHANHIFFGAPAGRVPAFPTPSLTGVLGYFARSSGDPANVALDAWNNNAVANVLSLRKYRGTPDAPTAVQSSDALGSLDFCGYDGTSPNPSVRLLATAAQTFGVAQGTTLAIQTKLIGSASLTNRLVFDGTGLGTFTNNIAANSLAEGYTTTVSGSTSGATTLTKDSTTLQYVTGTAAHTFTLPDTTTLVNGRIFVFVNLTKQVITVRTSAANLLVTLPLFDGADNIIPQVFCTRVGATSGTSAWSVATVALSTDTGLGGATPSTIVGVSQSAVKSYIDARAGGPRSVTPSDTIAAASTINLDALTGTEINVTGNTPITAITLADGVEKVLRFTGATTLTNGASLITPGGLENIVTANGDWAVVRGGAAGVVTVRSYQDSLGYSFRQSDNIYMTPGANIGFANLASPYFDVGKGETLDSSFFLRITKGGNSKFIKNDLTAAVSLDFAVTDARILTFADWDGTIETRVAVPAATGSAGVAGQVAYDSTHEYRCVATNTWKRVTIATW